MATEDSTFKDRMQQAQENAKEKIEQRKRRVKLTDQEFECAEKTYPLIDNVHFKEYQKVFNIVLSSRMRSPYKRESAIYDSTNKNNVINFSKTFGEDMSFNEGFQEGLVYFARYMNGLWANYLAYLEDLKNQKKGDNK